MSISCDFFCCKQKTAYEMRMSDWSSDVCSSDLIDEHAAVAHRPDAPGDAEHVRRRRVRRQLGIPRLEIRRRRGPVEPVGIGIDAPGPQCLQLLQPRCLQRIVEVVRGTYLVGGTGAIAGQFSGCNSTYSTNTPPI